MDHTSFMQVFPAGAQLPYDRNLIADIESSRKTFEGTLFIDRVLRALGITKAKAYPPKTDAALRQLHQQICESSMSLHHKYSLLYYILLDFDPEAVGQRSAPSEDFASSFGMPANYQLFMKGLWHLDRKEFSTAVEYVSHPSLVPDFADDIITCLVNHAPADDYSLPLAYFYTVQPMLKTSTALELLFDAMAKTNATEALLYSRTHPEHTREVLFRRLVASTANASPDVAGELAFLPFDAEEGSWFEQYLTSGEGKALKKAKDLLMIRNITGDQFEEVSKKKGGNSKWAPIIEGIKAGTEGHRE